MAKYEKLPAYGLLRAFYLAGKYTSTQVGELIGGRVQQNLVDPDQPAYRNTCALRVSRALNFSGAVIRGVPGVRMSSGRGRALWYIYSVRDMKVYLKHRYGPPAVERTGKSNGDVSPADFSGKHGIILFEDYHVDLWNGSSCEYHCSFGEVPTVMLWEAP